MQDWSQDAIFDCECPKCRGALSLDRQTIDGGLASCPVCGCGVDTRDLREALHQAAWELEHRHAPAATSLAASP